MITITSEDNQNFRKWLDISKAKGIKKHQEFILMGEKLIYEFLNQKDQIAYPMIAEILTPGLKPLTNSQSFYLSSELFQQVDIIGTHFNLLVLKTKEFPTYNPHKSKGFELICPLGDPLNLGAVSRSALAFGAHQIVLTSEATTPFHPKAIKASSGAVLKMNYSKTVSLNEFINSNNDPSLYALDMNGQNISSLSLPSHMKLIVGEEGPGLGFGEKLKKISIPTENVESLNANIAASITMYLWKNSKAKNKLL